MKRFLVAVGILACMISIAGCKKKGPAQRFMISGTYFADGTILTDDGHEWGYEPGLVIGDYARVLVSMSDAGTPDCREDDLIIGITRLEGVISAWM